MPANILGKGINRIDGRAKVTGKANYAADNNRPGLIYAYGVFSTVARGYIQKIDTSDAERAPGFVGVWHFGKAPKLYRSPNDMEQGNRVGEVRPPFEDNRIYYAGQFVAVVVAETFEQARVAARAVRVTYRDVEKPVLSIQAGIGEGRPYPPKEQHEDGKRGDAQAAFATAAVKVDQTYFTPVEVHNPMELHSTVAAWKEGKLELHDSTQWIVGQGKALAKVLGVPQENITVYAPFVGGGFGGKLFLWPHSIIAAFTAREVDRPVKLVLPRQYEFTTVGHRPATQQRVQLGASPDGKLVSVRHESLSHTSMVHEFLESCAKMTRSLYSCPDLEAVHRVVPVNVGTPTSMRAPGAASGLFALESAMDELAIALKMDPIELRLRNDAAQNEDKNIPWTSKYLKECYQQASDRFGWKRRNPEVGSMRDGPEIIGWGFAAAFWPSERVKANVRVQLRGDGSARVFCATQDIGTGTYTVAAQMAAEALGLPVEKIEVSIGNSGYPEGPISGGSMVTATIGPAIAEAAQKATETLIKLAGKNPPFSGADPKSLSYIEGSVVGKDGKRATIAEVLKAANIASADGTANVQPDEDQKKFSANSFGAHCVEVRYDPGIAKLRVSRIVSCFDVGRVINQKTARNQIYGSLLMGLGMALLEESVYDPRDGHVVTDNVADYLMPLCADTPEMDVSFIDRPDEHNRPFGIKGVGEIGITGAAAAIANAVYHATGKRVRDLPIAVEKLLI